MTPAFFKARRYFTFLLRAFRAEALAVLVASSARSSSTSTLTRLSISATTAGPSTAASSAGTTIPSLLKPKRPAIRLSRSFCRNPSRERMARSKTGFGKLSGSAKCENLVPPTPPVSSGSKRPPASGRRSLARSIRPGSDSSPAEALFISLSVNGMTTRVSSLRSTSSPRAFRYPTNFSKAKGICGCGMGIPSCTAVQISDWD